MNRGSTKREEQVLKEFIGRGLTLSVAESCTGGSLSARLTSLPGSSEYFLGGMVVYSNQMKVKWLGIPMSLIKEKGAVSSEVVEAMVRGILKKSGSDYALAATGIAGPSGGTLEKPVGTVWCGIGQKNRPIHSWRIETKGTRQEIIEATIDALLEKLLDFLPV
jgi:PncC family amidohydrolase